MTGCTSIYISLLQNECNMLGFQPQEKAAVLVVTFRSETSNRDLWRTKGSESHTGRGHLLAKRIKSKAGWMGFLHQWTGRWHQDRLLEVPNHFREEGTIRNLGTPTSALFPALSLCLGCQACQSPPPRSVTPSWDSPKKADLTGCFQPQGHEDISSLKEIPVAGSPRSLLERAVDVIFHPGLSRMGRRRC